MAAIATVAHYTIFKTDMSIETFSATTLINTNKCLLIYPTNALHLKHSIVYA
jgi:hypothetical protein